MTATASPPSPKRPRLRLRRLAPGFILAASLPVPAPALATAGSYDLAAIDHAVIAFTGAEIGTPGGPALPVDRRLRLAECSAPLALSWRGNRHDTVQVQCPDAGSWHLFVPVRLLASQSGPRAVDRGDAVTIAITGENFSVSQPGEALEAGAVGDWIRVRAVKDSGPQSDAIRAKIVSPGEVEIPSP